MNGFGVSPLELMASDAMLKGLVYLDEFTYSVSFVTGTDAAIGSGNTKEIQMLINGDSDFIVQEQNIVAYDSASPAVAVVNPNLLATITRAGSGRQIMNQAQHVSNIFGSYIGTKYPGRRPMPGLWLAANTITVKLQNLSTTVFSRVDVAFTGYKIFYTTVDLPDGSRETGNRKMIFHTQ